MQSTAIPTRLTTRWAQGANSSYVRDIPASDSGLPTGQASLNLGFPPVTALPIASGGIPPDIRDMNGILRTVSDWTRWVASGGPVPYDAAFATAIGGYPKGAILASSSLNGTYWFNGVDNNLSDPDGATPSNWTAINYLMPSTIPVSKGGTGLTSTPNNGDLLIGNGTGYTKNPLSAGPGINIVNTAGNITISHKLAAGKGVKFTTSDNTVTIENPSAVIAWARFVGATGAIIASSNIQSVTRNGVGNYTLVPITPFDDTSYGVAGSVRYPNDSDTGAMVVREGQTHSVNACGVITTATNYGGSALTDFPYVTVMIVR